MQAHHKNTLNPTAHMHVSNTKIIAQMYSFRKYGGIIPWGKEVKILLEATNGEGDSTRVPSSCENL